MDAGWATFVLSHWCRDTGLYSVGEAVRRVSSAPARILGLADRGTLAVGKRADVNVIDLDALHEKHPEIVHDFPARRATLHPARARVCRHRLQTVPSSSATTSTRASGRGTVLRT